MDYSDINTRLDRIYASVDQKNKYGIDALTSVRTKYTKGPGSTFQFSIVFGEEGETPVNLNQIHTIISNIANLKDCLKSAMIKQDKDGELIEQDINNSTFLQLILDLSNQEKHGYPLTRVRRSKKDPQIKNISGALTVSNKPDGITYVGSDGARVQNMMVTVVADITDSGGARICSLDELVDGAISAWEKAIDKHALKIV